jgi:hypothetical protein
MVFASAWLARGDSKPNLLYPRAMPKIGTWRVLYFQLPARGWAVQRSASVDTLELRLPRSCGFELVLVEHVRKVRERRSGPAGDVLGEGDGARKHGVHIHDVRGRPVGERLIECFGAVEHFGHTRDASGVPPGR